MVKINLYCLDSLLFYSPKYWIDRFGEMESAPSLLRSGGYAYIIREAYGILEH